jgi:hypothetical protein
MESYISNTVAARARAAKTRQFLKLEPDPRVETPSGGMRRVSPPVVPANNPGAAKKAVEDDIDYDGFQLKPEKELAMLSRIQGFIDRNNNGIDDRQEGSAAQPATPPSEPTNAPPAPAAPSAGVPPKDPRIDAALGPVKAFHAEHGRLPTPEELAQVAAQRQLKAQLGRDPTESELMLYRTPPPRGLGSDGK